MTYIIGYPNNKKTFIYEVPSSVRLIKSFTFQSKIIQELIFNNEELVVEKYACLNPEYNNLRVINIKTNKIKEIEVLAFNMCNNLKLINFNGTYKEWKKCKIHKRFWAIFARNMYEVIDGKKKKKTLTLNCLDKKVILKPHIWKN